MRSFKNEISNYLLIGATIFVLVYFIYINNFSNFFEFINSSFFVSLVTLLVGSFAIYLYTKKRRDYKKDISKLILQEIKYAEQQIREPKRQGAIFKLAFKILPTNSWYKNINLFTDDLEFTDIDSISRFYSQAEYVDNVIKIISDYKNNRENFKLIPSLEKSPKKQIKNGEKIDENDLDKITKEVEKEILKEEIKENIVRDGLVVQRSLDANDILKKVTKEIEFIYQTDAVRKIKEIANIN